MTLVHLESLLPTTYTSEQLADLGTRLDYYEELNLGLLIAGAHERLGSRTRTLGQERVGGVPTWRNLANHLESTLILLLVLPTSTSLDYERLSGHSRRYKYLGIPPVVAPSVEYLRRLLYTDQRVWGTAHGSLGYYLHLAGYREHYAHPSRLVYEAVRGLVSSNSARVPQWANYYQGLLVDDLGLLYTRWKQVLSLPTGIERARAFLQGLEQEAGVKSELSALLMRYWVVPGVSGLEYQLWHGMLDPALHDLYQEIWTLGTSRGLLRESTLPPAVPGLLRNVSAEIVQGLPYPGGMNTLLVAVAAHLVNLAYVLAYNYERSQYPIYALPDTEERERLGNVRRHLYLAGLMLRRCSLDHLVIVGNNLCLLSQLDDADTGPLYEL